MPRCACGKRFLTEEGLHNHGPYCPHRDSGTDTEGLLDDRSLPGSVRALRAEGRAFLAGQGDRVRRYGATATPPGPAAPPSYAERQVALTLARSAGQGALEDNDDDEQLPGSVRAIHEESRAFLRGAGKRLDRYREAVQPPPRPNPSGYYPELDRDLHRAVAAQRRQAREGPAAVRIAQALAVGAGEGVMEGVEDRPPPPSRRQQQARRAELRRLRDEHFASLRPTGKDGRTRR